MSATITKTVVNVPGYGVRELTGFDLTEAQVRDTMRDAMDLTNFSATTTVEGETKYITFQRRTGNKG